MRISWRTPPGYKVTILLWLFCGVFAQPGHAADWIYTVRPGDSLWDLSELYLHDVDYHQQLREYNQIEDPKQIPPGTKLRIPVAWLKLQPASVTVLYVWGEVLISASANEQPDPLQVGDSLAAGSIITTGTSGSVKLRFADGSVMHLLRDSKLVLDTISSFANTGMVDTRLRLRSGATDNQVKPLRGPESRYQITSPAAVSAVRGTHLRTAYDPVTETARCEVLSGYAELTAEGQSVSISAGEGSLARLGEPPSTPQRLLDAPDLTGLPQQIPRGSTLSWPALYGAVAYRLQLFSTHGEQGLVAELFSETTDTSLPGDLGPGDYLLLLRAIDGIGLEGKSAEHRLSIMPEIDTTLEPPAAIAPEIPPHSIKPYVQHFPQHALIFWKPVKGAQGYQFQLSREPGFVAPILDKVVTAPRIPLKQPGIKPLHFRLRSLQESPGAYGPTYLLQWQPVGIGGGTPYLSPAVPKK
jgi:hypothetical protein